MKYLTFPYLLLLSTCSARFVTLSNVVLPRDTTGAQLITGELSVLPHGGLFFLYANDWGNCSGIDCCPSSAGCASCCFTAPPYSPDLCVYTPGHSVVAYSTPDFSTFTPLGVVLPTSARRAGVEFRPQVVWNAATATAVMFYEDRWTGGGSNPGYAVATARTPAGPFTTLADTVRFAGIGRIGDYDVFVDDDGVAYHVRTGLTVQRLDENYTAPIGAPTNIPNPGVEGPAMFKRKGVYYLLVGVGCCACKGGSNVIVYVAPTPLGPFTLRGDVGSNKTGGHVFNAHSPYNYVTKAQQSKVVVVEGAGGGEPQYLWIGNQWVTGGARDRDLLYFAVLNFSSDGNITQMVYSETVELSVP